MGLTAESSGLHAVDHGLSVRKRQASDRVLALAGNPNVGKSTVFNALTGLRQHTGNWPGKTVTNAQGFCTHDGQGFTLVDLPGCYSLMAHSAEEETARDFLCFGKADAVLIVCDATCLERNLNLVLQILELTPNAVVCVNLMDEAARKGISIDFSAAQARLGVPVVGTCAREEASIRACMDAVKALPETSRTPYRVTYGAELEHAIALLQPALETAGIGGIPPRWLALRLLDADASLQQSLQEALGKDLLQDAEVQSALQLANAFLESAGLSPQARKDRIAARLVIAAEDLALDIVRTEPTACHQRDRKLDRILTGKWTGFPIMLLLLAGIFWITITGANIPSQWLHTALFRLEEVFYDALCSVQVPVVLCELIVHGAYRVLAWVVSVLLPPMAIFFPIFTLLEDLGYLPRVAFNLDKCFQKCHACGKQSLSMCMSFGCNAAGIVGCRIIDSPRERLIAILTNNFIPCNGRFPALISIITMFFIGSAASAPQSLLSAFLLAGLIVIGILMTFAVSRLLSATLLKGLPSSFTLELPPFRKPQIGRILVRSVLDRTLFVLGRAVSVAAPAGLLLWLMANVTVSGETLLHHCAGFLDPFGRLLGMDGVILMAFILGFPANEIVIPIMIMAYMANGNLVEMNDLAALRALFVDNGWTWLTAANVLLFSLMHWPCSTTLLTVKAETQSLKWTLLAFWIPTIAGICCCFAFTSIARIFV